MTPRVRMIAGPNGSGKSTLKEVLAPHLIENYINPDEIENNVRACGSFSTSDFGLSSTGGEIIEFLKNSTLLRKANLLQVLDLFDPSVDRLHVPAPQMNSYFASVFSDFLRRKLIQANRNFTFETVMSSEDKIKLLKECHDVGYRTYLYYIATEDPLINIDRVRRRVARGGHNVPEDKIISRYSRSLALLSSAIRNSNRAYIFDNSGEKRMWIAEITGGHEIALKTNRFPGWFKKYVADRLSGEA